MKEFVLFFRWDIKTKEAQPTPEQMKEYLKQWKFWIESIVAQNKLANSGHSLDSDGKVVKSNNVVTDGPYTEIKEAIGGYIIVNAKDYEDAVRIAKGCPILLGGGNVEVRKTVAMD